MWYWFQTTHWIDQKYLIILTALINNNAKQYSPQHWRRKGPWSTTGWPSDIDKHVDLTRGELVNVYRRQPVNLFPMNQNWLFYKTAWRYSRWLNVEFTSDIWKSTFGTRKLNPAKMTILEKRTGGGGVTKLPYLFTLGNQLTKTRKVVNEKYITCLRERAEWWVR